MIREPRRGPGQRLAIWILVAAIDLFNAAQIRRTEAFVDLQIEPLNEAVIAPQIRAGRQLPFIELLHRRGLERTVAEHFAIERQLRQRIAQRARAQARKLDLAPGHRTAAIDQQGHGNVAPFGRPLGAKRRTVTGRRGELRQRGAIDFAALLLTAPAGAFVGA
jgi:hypothetical protein